MRTPDTYTKYVEPIIKPLIDEFIVFRPVEEQLNFEQKIVGIATNITDDILEQLLWDSDEHCRLASAWLIFIKNKIEFTDNICKLFVQTKLVTRGHCYALAKFGTLKCSEQLCKYLEEELPFDKFPNEGYQDTAIYALLYIDNKNKTGFSKKFLEPGGLWAKFSEFKYRLDHKFNGQATGYFDKSYKDFVTKLDFMNTINAGGN